MYCRRGSRKKASILISGVAGSSMCGSLTNSSREKGDIALECATVVVGKEIRVRGLHTQCGINFFMLDSRRGLAPAPKVLGPKVPGPKVLGPKHIPNQDFAPS